MAGRPKQYEDTELIDRATAVFWEKGYFASSAKDLLEAMDVGQGSFYRSFPGGKRELYMKSLARFHKQSHQVFVKGLSECEDPKQYIKDFFYSIISREKGARSNGCYLGNAVIESSNLDEEVKKMSASILKKLKASFEKALTKAQEMGNLDADKSPKLLAERLLNLWNGINITQRMYTTNKEVKNIIDASLKMLD